MKLKNLSPNSLEFFRFCNFLVFVLNFAFVVIFCTYKNFRFFGGIAHSVVIKSLSKQTGGSSFLFIFVYV